MSPDQLPLTSLRAAGKTIATLNGAFDILHAGHLYILEEAAAQADILIVALNTDASIKHNKGPERPFITLADRAALLSALSCVDYVTYFDEPDPRSLLAYIRPDVHVNGAEYGHDCIEAPTVKAHGGRLHLVPRIEGLSTSSLIEKIRTANAVST